MDVRQAWSAKDMGNLSIDGHNVPRDLDNSAAMNLTDLVRPVRADTCRGTATSWLMVLSISGGSNLIAGTTSRHGRRCIISRPSIAS